MGEDSRRHRTRYLGQDSREGRTHCLWDQEGRGGGPREVLLGPGSCPFATPVTQAVRRVLGGVLYRTGGSRTRGSWGDGWVGSTGRRVPCWVPNLSQSPDPTSAEEQTPQDHARFKWGWGQQRPSTGLGL